MRILLLALLTGCVTVPRPLPLPAAPKAPDWTVRDCELKGGAYVLTGFGVTRELAEVKARQNALLCVFGGDYQVDAEARETNAGATLKSRIAVTLQAKDTDWTGFEQSAAFKDDRGTYVQYRWREDAAKASRERFQAARDKELAFKRLSAKEKNRHYAKMLSQLYCGATVADAVAVLGEPDVECQDAVYLDHKKQVDAIGWGEYRISVEPGITFDPTCEGNLKQWLTKRIKAITPKYGQGRERNLCS